MPFLNGGLFSENEWDEIGFDVPDEVFEWLFEPDLGSSDKKKGFLEIFNFIIDEATPLDVEVAVDPEMLGKVYEFLINEEERGTSGIFYTPRNEIDFMSRLSLVEYLHAKTGIDKQDLIDLIFNSASIGKYENIDKLKLIRRYLEEVKIVDLTVGSASFLVGMMNILVDLHSELTKRIESREENLFALKNKIILENLYGFDVKDWAVMVGELSLWLSLNR
ncbi:DNA methyltransferase [Thermodesulfobacterium hveragerdense]|uniref:DNA methyltransferase n=1 Tax=Thermodesulfobacterium hveragerdense TaxID=53424 RepID=UPI0003F722DC|nr:DNA methyltransferase [Thermodesulfobacterium hveragerdense]